jgi:hypothetical protein
MRCLGGLHEERELQRVVTDLAICGVRPTTIRAVIGHGISLAEITRIFKLATFLTPEERRGRAIKPSNLKRMGYEHLLLYSQLTRDVLSCTAGGATRADALSAVWRVETDRRSLPAHSAIAGACLEDLAILFLNLEAGELSLDACARCGAAVLSLDAVASSCPCRERRLPVRRAA